jgi:hypothetical protein
VKKNTAINVAIEALKYRLARQYVVGHNAYEAGVKERWTKSAHKEYIRYTKAIEVLESLRDKQEKLL